MDKLLIDDILIDGELVNTYFQCDLTKCKGACCTFEGEWGAPLLDVEIPIMQDILEITYKYLTSRSINHIKKHNFYEGKQGDYTTVCINKRDCVFVYYDGDVAKCAIEKAYFNGETDFQKPISCHLFPIRIRNAGRTHLHYQEIEECESALVNGKMNKVTMFECIETALERAFGVQWVNYVKESLKI